jgi:heat shock protein HtpX
MVVCWFSRFREFRADRGGADIAGRDKMIAALESLQKMQGIHDPQTEKPSFQALKISTRNKTGIMMLFATHPPLDERISRLRQLA